MCRYKTLDSKLEEDNVGHQLLKKMGEYLSRYIHCFYRDNPVIIYGCSRFKVVGHLILTSDEMGRKFI